MNPEAWFVLAVVVAILIAMMSSRVSPAVAMSAGMVAVLVADVVTTEQALAGFSNAAPLTVAALFILARAVEKTGALTPMVKLALGGSEGRRRSIARLVLPAATASSFLNNTPIVAMLLPEVRAWAKSRKKSASLFLMPLSFAALLGGVVTLIGTSTNLVVSGLLVASGEPEMGFFEVTAVGLPIAVIGVFVLIGLTPLLLPDRTPVDLQSDEQSREFVVDMVVAPGGPLQGKGVEAAGLRHLDGLFLATVERNGDLIAPVTPETVLAGGDRLRFVGRADNVLELQKTRGLISSEAGQILHLQGSGSRYFEVVIGIESMLVGQTLSEAGFRGRYQAAVLAIHRAGQRIEGKLGQIPIRVGDVLLLVADDGFRDRWRDRNDFLLVSGIGQAPSPTSRRAWIVGALTLGLVLTASLDLIPILSGSLVAAVALVAFKVLTPGEARGAVDLDVILVIAAAFGVAAAVEESGLAAFLASGLVNAFSGMGDRGVLLGVVLATVILTAVLSNNAAALLMFPIAVASASATNIQSRGFAVAVAVAASVDFLTPIGYQTNTMVYGPGGYRFGDYARLGTPLTLLVSLVIVVVVPGVWAR
ncbi:MAG: SLC13 family permease [Actinobacteria bacterium]|nr:SLC13 family permease [Actinomycetota bacterium]